MKAYNQEQMTKNVAAAAAYNMSRFIPKIIEVRQVTRDGFIYCERGFANDGELVQAWKSGQVVA